MTKSEKRRNTCRVRMLELIRAYPGIQALDRRIKPTYRNHLRQLKVEGYIEYRDGWYRTGKEFDQ